jgi:hypothetical protein
VGRGAASSFDMTGGTACEASSWKSNSGVECKLSAGVGGGAPIVQGRGLPVVVTFGLQQGSRTQAWCYAAAVVSSVGGVTNGPSSGSTCVFALGLSFGSSGISGRGRPGRRSLFSTEFRRGSACEASSWKSNSGVKCKISSWNEGGADGMRAKFGLPVVVTFGLQQGSRTQAWCYDGGQVTSISFAIAASDRVAGKAGASATFSFMTSSAGVLATGSNITLTYPSAFFVSTGTPGVRISGGGPTATAGSPTSTQIVITTATQAIAASTAMTMTVTGLTMGAATAGNSTGIIISTSVDQTASFGVSSGVIGGQVTNTSFAIAASDRVAGKTGAAATFSFTTTAGGALAAGSNITLTYPSAFFVSTGTPGVRISGGGPTATAGSPTSTQIVITTATQAIAASTAMTMIVTGLTMGAATAGNSTGIIISTSVDQTASFGVSSGVIGGQVTNTSFAIAASDRVAGKTGAAATFSFTTTAGGALAAGSNITLTYPSAFFVSTGTPGVRISGGGPTATAGSPTSTQIVITTATQAIAASTAMTMTVTGLTMGAATAGNSTGIIISTSVDQTASLSMASGIVVSGPVSSISQSSLPSTAHSKLFIFGTGLSGWSVKVRIGASACASTTWLSDSLVICRTSSGVGLGWPVTASVNYYGIFDIFGTLSKAFSYNAPSPVNATSQRLSGISVTGANFGPYLAVVSRASTCSDISILSPKTSANVCNSSHGSSLDSGFTFTEAIISITFFNPSRLDDVVIFLRSPKGLDFTLMRNKCFGTLPCGTANSITFNFQILPIAQLFAAPSVACPAVGTYVPDDFDLIKQELSSSSALAQSIWSVRISTGSEPQNVSRVSVNFTTTALDFRIGDSSISSLEWVSDSSVSLKAPGYLGEQPADSSSGWGRNRSVTGLINGFQSMDSCMYSYPDPSVSGISGASTLSSSGSTTVNLLGRYFSNTNPHPQVRMGISACGSTKWQSDTVVTCIQSSLHRSAVISFGLSIDRSAIANYNSTLSLFPVHFKMNQISVSATTAASTIFLVGGGLGPWDATTRARLSISSAAATVWLSDTHISIKAWYPMHAILDIVVSVSNLAISNSIVGTPLQCAAKISSSTASNVPTTGSAVISLSGANFALYSTSSRFSLGVTSCPASGWVSDCSILCKTPSGLRQLVSTVIMVTFAQVMGNSSGIFTNYDNPTANRSADIVSNNSEVCFVNSSGCAPGRVIRFGHSSSGFGVHKLPQLQLSVIQGTFTSLCYNSTWVSDSSAFCLFSSYVSPEFRELTVVVESTGSRLQIKNPSYIPAPPPLNNETVKIRFYSRVSFPEGEDKGFRDFGTTTDFRWPVSSVADSVQYSEVMNISALVFIDASQVFLNEIFLPVQSEVSVNITVWSTSDLTSLVLCEKANSKNVSIVLGPQLFWAKTIASLTFCTPKHLNGQRFSLRAIVDIYNVMGNLTLIAASPEFYANSSGLTSIKVNDAIASYFVAGVVHDGALSFRFFYGSSLDNDCEFGGRSMLEYKVALLCGGKTSDFHPMKLADAYTKSDRCLLSVTGISFVKAAKNCYFNISVRTDAIVSRASQIFEVIPGVAQVARLIGAGPFCASAGAIVWSLNSSIDGLCLVAQLEDALGNNVTSAVNATVIARTVTSSEQNYAIARKASNRSSESGVILWCDAYSSTIQNVGIVFGAAVNGNATYWLSSVINVSSAGPVSNILPRGSSVSSNQILMPNSAPSKMNFSLQDVGGNDVFGRGVTVRVRVVPRSIPSRSAAQILALLVPAMQPTRRLLQLGNTSTSCDAKDLEFFFSRSESSGELVAGPERICQTGINDIFFDIGTLSGTGTFSATVLSSFQMNFTVVSGPFQSFMLVFDDSMFPTNFTVKSYQLIQTLEIMFLDAGLNEVSGNSSITLRRVSGEAELYPNEEFTTASNTIARPPVKAMVPPFFLFMLAGNPTAGPVVVKISSGNSSIPKHPSSVVSVNLYPMCLPGYHTIPIAHSILLLSLKTNRMESSSLCSICDRSRQFSSWYYDAPRCMTMAWPDLPRVVQSGRDIDLKGSVLLNDESAIFQNSESILITVSLVRGFSGRSPYFCNTTLENGLTKPCKIKQIAYQQRPDNDYTWSLQLKSATDVNVTLMSITLPVDGGVTVLDFAPVVGSASPSNLSFAGGSFVTLTGVFPLGATSNNGFHMNSSVPVIANDTCLLKSNQMAGLASIVVPAKRILDTRTSIQLVCGPLPAFVSGPPFTKWTPHILLSDGRNSTEASTALQSFCPVGFYIHNLSSSAHLECRACPKDVSITLKENEPGIQSCVCNAGHYGSYGEQCLPCPKNVEGFNCTLTNQTHPSILAGYYIIYSKMRECTEYGAKCNAVIKCPNPGACPGTKEKDCLKKADECYDSETFGCVSCCPKFFMENLKCSPCPASQLPLLLGLATAALILFAVLSTSFDFPPLVLSAQSLKVFLSGIQGYVSIRLISIEWPPIVLDMFDFTRFFTFSFDVIRPECTVDYSPQTKLVFVLIGPFACSFLILMMAFIYSGFKCMRITKLLQCDSVQRHLNWSYWQTASSVANCLFASSLCLKFSKSAMMRDGSLWNALNPSLALRSDTTVLRQKSRRRTVLQQHLDNFAEGRPIAATAIPKDWALMQAAVAELNAENEFSRTSKRFRLLISSALSLFVFTFQGSVEAALSTFDCKEVNGMLFLRSNPKVICSPEDDGYVTMIAIAIAGMAIYCGVLPLAAIVALRSRWCREVYIHDNMAYSQIFGFLTSLYTKACSLWELVACTRKVVFVAIPILISKESLVQSLSMFLWLILYTFAITRMQPMISSHLNQIEVLSCVAIMIGSFSSIMFVIEYNGKQVLTGASRDLAGLFLVFVCAACALMSVYLIAKDCRSKRTLIAVNLHLHVCLNLSRIDLAAQRHFYLKLGRQHHDFNGRRLPRRSFVTASGVILL